MIRRLWLKWIYRDLSRDSLEETHLILLKSARRCGYDLRHAVDQIYMANGGTCETYEAFKHRANFWLKIFSPTEIKNYRLELHSEIEKLEDRIEVLENKLKEHGIEVPFNNQPF